MKKLFSVALMTFVFLTIASASFATTIGYDSGPAPGSIVYDFEDISVGPLLGNYTLGAIGTITSTSNSVISNISNTNGAVPVGSTGNYLAVKGGGETIMSFTNPDNHNFGLLWGSMDTFNKIKFTFADNTVLSFNGADVAAGAGANGSWTDIDQNRYVNFTFDKPLNNVAFSSGTNSFEMDKFSISATPVPEPTTAFLFGIGVLGFAGISRKRKTA